MSTKIHLSYCCAVLACLGKDAASCRHSCLYCEGSADWLKSQEGDKVPEHEAQAFSKWPFRATDSGGFQSNGAASSSW